MRHSQTLPRRDRRSRLTRLSSATVIDIPTIRQEATPNSIGIFVARAFFLVVAATCLAATWWLLTDPRFRVARVEVHGAYFLNQDDVARAVGAIGRPIWEISSRETRARTMSLGVPIDATVSYRLPDVVVAALDERPPAYDWRVEATTYAVSEDGIVLGPADKSVERFVVVDLDASPIQPGARVDPSILREASYLSNGLPNVVGISITSFEYSSDLGLAFSMPGGTRIVVGDDQNLDRKLSVIAMVWSRVRASLPARKILDVRVAARPILRSSGE